MKQVEKIWAELSAKAQEVETPQESTELSEEVKVELATDLNRAFSQLESVDKNLRNAEQVMDKAYVKYKATLKEAEDTVDRVDSIVSEVAMDARKLGVDESAVPNLKESIALGQKLLTIIRGMEKMYN
jgi:uncharacterized protein (DUF3084 family)